MSKNISVVSIKGGVAKTTTSVNLGTALADAGKKVLIVDDDPQYNLTTALGIKPNEIKLPDIFMAVIQNEPDGVITEYINNSIVNKRENLDIIPSDLSMAALETILPSAMKREYILKDEATYYVTETNLKQRAFLEMSHTERALCLSQNFNCLKNQGKRNDLTREIDELLNPHGKKEKGTSAEVQRRLETKDKIAQKNGISRDKVAKYIRIATLVPDFLEFLDTKKIAFLAAYDLSFIEDKNKQTLIADIIKRDNCKIDMKKASLLREYYDKNKLTDKAVEEIISGVRVGKNVGPRTYKVKSAVLKQFFTAGETQDEIDETVTRALTMYFANQNGEPDENTNFA